MKINNIELPKGSYTINVYDTCFDIIDTNKNCIYCENSDGFIVDNRKPKVAELTIADISKLLGYDIKIIKE